MAEKSWIGHRQRLRERFLVGGPEKCSDEMLLELLLTFAIRRKDVKPLAQELVKIFGSLEQVLSVPPDDVAASVRHRAYGPGPAWRGTHPCHRTNRPFHHPRSGPGAAPGTLGHKL